MLYKPKLEAIGQASTSRLRTMPPLVRSRPEPGLDLAAPSTCPPASTAGWTSLAVSRWACQLFRSTLTRILSQRKSTDTVSNVSVPNVSGRRRDNV